MRAAGLFSFAVINRRKIYIAFTIREELHHRCFGAHVRHGHEWIDIVLFHNKQYIGLIFSTCYVIHPPVMEDIQPSVAENFGAFDF